MFALAAIYSLMVKRKNIVYLIVFCFFTPLLHAQNFTKGDFEAYAGVPLSSKYGQVSAVKVVYDLQTERLHFINAKQFKYHHEYCRFYLNYNATLQEFNDINYSANGNRRFLLANINYFEALNKYVLEIPTVDLMSFEYIMELHSIVANATFINDSLYFLLNSPRLQSADSYFLERIRSITPSEIYQNQVYQAISKHFNCGTLRFIHDIDSELENIVPNDIVIINGTPLFLPNVSGVLVTEFQTPLSHLTILGQNRKIPIAAYKNAFQDSALLKLKDQNVCYTVSNNEFIIEKNIDTEQIEIKHKAKKLKYDLETDTLVGVEFLTKKSYRYAGNKASNFGHLYRLSQKAEFKVPEAAFIIPFYFYDQHIKSSEANELIKILLADTMASNNQELLRSRLKIIRKAIKQQSVDANLLEQIYKRVDRSKYTRLRFRSSTNAEDAVGFSGAGLYTSKTGIAGDSLKTFEKAIQKVWASLWSYESFVEREYYGINHNEVFMGVLVHRSFPSEAVNGVAVTKNLYRPESYGFVVNAQLGNFNVVQPDSGIISDQFICYPDGVDNIYKDKTTVDIITVSNLNSNNLVMAKDEIQLLANQLEVLKHYFIRRSRTTKSYLDYGLDVEFKLDGNSRQLYFKQVRYYND